VGIAEAADAAPAGTLDAIRTELDAAFDGLSEAFLQACSIAAARRVGYAA
jgi:hypothetical protein